jgi:acyl-coenzyme A thioesterase PaaI-like protein
MNGSNELTETLRADPADAPSEVSLARREIAEAVRVLCHALGGSQASPERMRDLAAQLRGHGEALRDAEPTSAPSPSGGPSMVPGMDDFHDRGPIAGRANPLAPPATLGVDRDAAIVAGEVSFGPAFEGAPGIVHGGFVAAVLDEALGMASALSGRACMTAELTTRFRSHTPISAPLRIEARLVSVDGRKVQTSGEIIDGDTVLAEASGVFIAVGAEKFEQLVIARSEKTEA